MTNTDFPGARDRRHYTLTVVFNDMTGERVSVLLGPNAFFAGCLSHSAGVVNFDLPNGGTFSFSTANAKHWTLTPAGEQHDARGRS